MLNKYEIKRTEFFCVPVEQHAVFPYLVSIGGNYSFLNLEIVANSNSCRNI